MGAVLTFHTPLGLRRIRGDQGDPPLPAHPPHMRHRVFHPLPLPGIRRPLVQVLPIHVQRQRHPVALDPRSQRIGHRPDRLLLSQLCPRLVAGVIDHVDQASLRPTILQPGVKAPVHLHHLSKMFLPAPPPPDGPPFPAPDSIIPPPASSGAASLRPLANHPRPPNAPRPASAQTVRPPHLRTSLGPARAPSAETSSRDRDSKAAPRCGAADRRRLPRDSASTVASLAGSSPASAARHQPHAAPRCAPVTALPPLPTPACSSPSAPS